MRRHWSGFAPKSKFTQHNFHHTCNLALGKSSLVDSIKFFLLKGVKKTSASRQEHRPPYRLNAFCRSSSTGAEHTKLGDFCRVITHGNVLNLWHHDSFLHIFEQHYVRKHSPCAKWLSESISIPTHCNCASTSRLWFGKFFLVVSLDWFFAPALLDTGHKAWALYGSRSCAPHWWREPRWLSASLLVSSSKSLSCFLLIFSWTIFLGSSTQTTESSKFSASSCPIFLVICCRVLRKEGKHEESKLERERERDRERERKSTLEDATFHRMAVQVPLR